MRVGRRDTILAVWIPYNLYKAAVSVDTSLIYQTIDLQMRPLNGLLAFILDKFRLNITFNKDF